MEEQGRRGEDMWLGGCGRRWEGQGGVAGGKSPLQSFKMSLAPLYEETVHTCTGNGSFTTGYPKDFLYRIKKL
jgi:hypothetical protein